MSQLFDWLESILYSGGYQPEQPDKYCEHYHGDRYATPPFQ
jgi:hypothetical protein